MSFSAELSALSTRVARHQIDPSAWAQALALVERAATGEGAADELVRLGAQVAQIGGMGFGRFGETAGAIHRLQVSPILNGADHQRRSLWRAEAVMREAGGDRQAAWDLLEKAIANPGDRVRYDALLAMTLAARGRITEALPIAERTAAACAELPGDDPGMAQHATVAENLRRIAAARLDEDRRLAAAAAALAAASDGRATLPAARHRAALSLIESHLAAGEPMKALAAVRETLDLEESTAADALSRAATLRLAAKAYAAKGDAAAAAKVTAASAALTERHSRTMPVQPE
jgi:tetratricopeptide (TPR) repeat protein